MDLNEMGVFATVVEQGSFTAAGDKLAMPKSTVSRHVSQLEERLNARLLNRTTRQLKLTEVGKLYFEHCRRILEEAEQAEQVIERMQSEPTGLLRLSMPVAFGTHFMQAWIREFLARYPKVDMELIMDDRTVDLVGEEVDIAIRVSELADSSLIARDLGQGHLVLCATPRYLERHGTPSHPDDLHRHSMIRHVKAPLALMAEGQRFDIPAKARLTVSDMSFIHQMILQSAGIGQIPAMLALEDVDAGRLVQVLPDYAFPTRPIYLVYASRRQQASKILAFVDFLLDKIRPTPPWEAPLNRVDL